MQQKHQAQKKETSEAQRATHDRDAAMDALDDWMSDFIGVSRIALSQDPNTWNHWCWSTHHRSFKEGAEVTVPAFFWVPRQHFGVAIKQSDADFLITISMIPVSAIINKPGSE